jgi:hypothetical protein
VAAAARAAKRYLHFLQKQLPLISEDVSMLIRQDMRLQQDGALPHFVMQMTAFLNQHFPDRCIG